MQRLFSDRLSPNQLGVRRSDEQRWLRKKSPGSIQRLVVAVTEDEELTGRQRYLIVINASELRQISPAPGVVQNFNSAWQPGHQISIVS